MSKKRSSAKRILDNEYGEYFQQARQRKGITQMDLAKVLGFSNNQLISNIERGLCRYPIKRLNKLIRLLDLDPEDIVRILLRREEKKIRKIIK